MKKIYCNVCKKNFNLPEERIRGVIACEYCNSPYWHLPQAPDAEAAIEALKAKSKIPKATNPKEYEQFSKAMDDIDKRYGFIK